MNELPWTTVISPRRGWFELDLMALWRYRDLIMLFVRRDFVAVYKQTVLGPFWYVLQPIFSAMIFTVVFGVIIGITTDGVPHLLFYLSGLVLWNYFSACFTRTSDILTANSGIFGKVYFPRLTVPVANVLFNTVTLFIQFALFLMVYAYYRLDGLPVSISGLLLLLPLLVLQTAALGFGAGMLVSSLTTKYRDLAFLAGFAVQLWMYATPIVYPLSRVPDNWRWFYQLNPMSFIVETFRMVFWGTGWIDPVAMFVSLVETVMLLAVGLGLFSRVEKTFMDTV